MMKPEPSELTRRGARSGLSPPPCPRRFLKNSSKNSSIGEPGGRSGIPVTRASTFCDVEILTTASITCSATSAMFSGPRAAAGCAGSMITAAISAAVTAPCPRRKAITQPARPLGTRLGRKSGPRTRRSAAHQVDDQHADQRRYDAGDTQRAVGHLQHGRHGALGANRERGKKDALDREEQAERGEEIGHEPGNPPHSISSCCPRSVATICPSDRRNSGRNPS